MLKAEELLFLVHGDLVEEEAAKRQTLAMGGKRIGSCIPVGPQGTFVACSLRDLFLT